MIRHRPRPISTLHATLVAAGMVVSVGAEPRLLDERATAPFDLSLALRPAAHEPPSEPYENLYRRFSVSLGGAFYASFDTALRVSSPVLIGANLDLEDFLGVESDATVFRFDSHYAFNRRHRVDLAYYDLRRSGSTTITDSIEFGDIVIPAGDVETFFNTSILKLAYRYNFVADDRTAIGASIGLHTMALDTGVSAPGFDLEEDFDFTAPLPLLGLHGTYALSHKWSLYSGFEALRLVVGNFDGLLLDARIGLDHDTFEHFGWGIGFNSFNMNLEVEQTLTADVEYSYSGVMLYLRAFF